MYCDNCGSEIPDNSSFCSNCGNNLKVKNKNMFIALVLTFFITGLGSIYAGNTKKGLILLVLRIVSAALSFFSGIFVVFSFIVWAYAFYEVYKDVQIANGHQNPKFIADFKSWDKNKKTVAVLIIIIILVVLIANCYSLFVFNKRSSGGYSNTHYYKGGSGSGGSSQHSSHYGGVDDSPHTIAKNDPDWYYDHYEYGDNDDIDEYLESQGYD